MKALFGVVSVLIALVIAGLVVTRQMKAVGLRAAVPAASDARASALPTIPASGNVRDHAMQLERQVADDVAKAMEQAAAARRDDPEK